MNRGNSKEQRLVIDDDLTSLKRQILGILLLFFLFGLTHSLPSRAEFDWKGELTLETRAFEDDADSSTEDVGIGLTALVELEGKHGPFRERVRLFSRTDAMDSERDLLIVEEAWVEYRRRKFQLRFGIDKFNWSATEAFHPADILNSRNLDSDLENFEKIGEPIIGVVIPVSRGEISMFYLPVQVDPEFPSQRSRLNLAPAGWTFEDPIWGRRDGSIDDNDLANQWMIRWLQSQGSIDYDFHFIRHTDRSQPIFVPLPEKQKVQPVYLPVQQIGGTLQAMAASWLVKFEWAYRDFEPLETDLVPEGVIDQPSHWQVAWGLEYNRPYVGGGTSTWVLEGQSVLGVEEATRAELSIFQQDILLGYRFDFGDIAGRQFNASLIYDLERSREFLLSLSYSQRFSDRWRMRSGLRIIDAPIDPLSLAIGLQGLDGNNELRFSLIRGF